MNAESKSIGYALRDPQGKMLRRFVSRSRRAHGRVELLPGRIRGLSRGSISNGDNHLDECRWLNSGGSRIALIERGKITALEADLGRGGVEGARPGTCCRGRGLARDRDGKPGGADRRRRAEGRRRQGRSRGGANECEQLAALQKQLIGWNAQTVWNRFDGTFPHVIPADPAVGLAKDVTLYENAMVIPGTSADQQNAAKMAFLQIPDMIQLGSTWKFVELPHAIDPEKPIVAAATSMRSMLFDRAAGVAPAR